MSGMAPLLMPVQYSALQSLQARNSYLVTFPVFGQEGKTPYFFADSLAILIKTKYCLENIVA
jgi:hypothetical protein